MLGFYTVPASTAREDGCNLGWGTFNVLRERNETLTHLEGIVIDQKAEVPKTIGDAPCRRRASPCSRRALHILQGVHHKPPVRVLPEGGRHL
eukprot:2107466-Rhodomonas_salina.1